MLLTQAIVQEEKIDEAEPAEKSFSVGSWEPTWSADHYAGAGDQEAADAIRDYVADHYDHRPEPGAAQVCSPAPIVSRSARSSSAEVRSAEGLPVRATSRASKTVRCAPRRRATSLNISTTC